MSAPAPDPPPNPTGTGDIKPGDASSSTAPATAAPDATDAAAAAATEGDVKMDEPAKPEEIEDTLEDIPDHVREVSLPDVPGKDGSRLDSGK